MTESEFYDYINKLKAELPSPSEVESEDLVIPHGIYGFDLDTGTPQFGSITFTKERHNGITIGWKLKD